MKIIKESVVKILNSIPPDVFLLAAAKTRTTEELKAAIDVGVKIVVYNYIQEAERMFQYVGDSVQWHLIGYFKRNRAKRAVRFFDMIETIDYRKVAELVDHHCVDMEKVMPVLIEINGGRESSKTGLIPEDVDDNLFRVISLLSHLRIQGLMIMRLHIHNSKDYRPYFRATRIVFHCLNKARSANVRMRYLSMGISNS